MRPVIDREATTLITYLDNAATSWPKPEVVYKAVQDCMRMVGANPGRSGHRLSLEAGRLIESARTALACLFHVEDASRIVLAFNATDAINMALKGILKPGDHVVTSAMEHNSVMRPLCSLARAGKLHLTVVGADMAGLVTPDRILSALRKNTRLVVLTHASNVVGTVNPIGDIGAALRQEGVYFLVDAAQTVGVLPIDLSSLKVDLLAFSGHKGLLGPQGTGGLYVRPGVHLDAWREGGTGSHSEVLFQPESMPEHLEAGTPNTPGFAGLAAGVRYLLEAGVDTVRNRERELRQVLCSYLSQIPGVSVFGPSSSDHAIGVVSFNIDGIDPSDVAYCLDTEYGIMVRPGLHCAPGAHRTIGTFPRGTVRISLGIFTTMDDLKRTRDAVAEISRRP